MRQRPGEAGRGRPALAPEIQRRRLLDAARKALHQSGRGSFRVSDVVRAAGMSSRSFYDHFASKEDLILALIDDTGRNLLGQLEAIFATSGSFEEQVDRGLEAYLAAFLDTPLDPRKLGESASLTVLKRQDHYVRVIAAGVALLVDRLWHAGVLPRPQDPAQLEVLLLGLLGLASRYVTERRTGELASLRPRLRELVLRVLS